MTCTSGSGGGYVSGGVSGGGTGYYPATKESNPEELLADLIKADLGATINPQALRLWLRWRWDRITPMAHRIHNA